MSNLLAHIADKVVNRPMMILPGKLALIGSVLGGRIGLDAAALTASPAIDGLDGPPTEASRFVGEVGKDANGVRKAYRTSNGVAIIPVLGSLVNRGSFLDAMSGVTSYEAIKNAITKAAADPEVKSILLDIDSPGGEAVGAFEAADVVRAAASTKPVRASITGLCASAAYAIASAASRITISTSSMAGSVGVVMMHADHSHRLHEAGIVPTLIHAGAHKVDGNPLEKLTDGVKAELKAEIDGFYDLFVATVAKGRKGMSAKAIRDTEARTFIGAAAVKIGLADEVGSFESALAELGGGGSRTPAASSSNRIHNMTDSNNSPSADAERERIKAILGCPEAKGMASAAEHIAFKTTMSVDEAKAILAVAAQNTAPHQRRLDRGLDASIGLALMPESQLPPAAAGWDRAIAAANEHVVDPDTFGRPN